MGFRGHLLIGFVATYPQQNVKIAVIDGCCKANDPGDGGYVGICNM